MDTNTLNQAVETLTFHKDEWARLHPKRKADYVRAMTKAMADSATRAVSVVSAAKGFAAGTPMVGDEWASGPYSAVRNLRLLAASLDQIAAKGAPQLKRGSVHVRSDGQVTVEVFPLSVSDKMLYSGSRAEIWMERGITPENLAQNMAGFYRQKEPEGRVALVLGAGNVSSCAPLDMAHKLFIEGQVCLCKMNPVNEYLEPFLTEAFAGLIREGFVRITKGGSDVGDYLCQHPGIDEIHITGSSATFDAIVFGSGEEGARRKQSNQPRIRKRVTGELGNTGPVIVVPGQWSNADLEFQAANIATQMISNTGFNCNAARVLILPKGWSQSQDLIEKLKAVLASQPQRKAFYPGAEERFQRFTASNPSAVMIGRRQSGILPWTLIPNLDPSDRNNICFKSEAFCALLAQTAVDGKDAAEFLRNAVAFCNEVLWGTLCACIIVDPKTRESLGDALIQAVADLKYGTVSINHWPALGYLWGTPTWGAFPGHTYQDIQSGIGTIHNAFMFDRPQKSVVYGPFSAWPKPPWFVTNKKAHKILPKCVRLEASPSLGKTMGVAFTAMGG
jgi:acyl-CoA reductase-like NAD-dependent aldehyde dehydrogenase